MPTSFFLPVLKPLLPTYFNLITLLISLIQLTLHLWKIPWRRERLPTPVLWPGEFHGLYSPWGCEELDTIEQLSLSLRDKMS